MNVDIRSTVKKYIKKSESPSAPERKMDRNLQPEIEKLKSVQNSIRGMYVNSTEKQRILDEVERLKKTIEVL